MSISLNPATTALVMIDLQKGILAMENIAPHSPSSVLEKSLHLAARVREAGGLVVPVHVGFDAWGGRAPRGLTDAGSSHDPAAIPAEWSELADGVAQPGDLVTLKNQWGAFTGTGLDDALRRRGIDTIVLVGIATNIGVESTARHAWELNYNVVVVEDACATFSREMHDASFSVIFPRIARCTTTDALTFQG